MGSRWGINRTVGQIYALLFLSSEPLNAEDIVERLGVSRSNVSMGLKELQAWNLVRLQHRPGDRREYFSTPDGIWQMVRPPVEGGKKRGIGSTTKVPRGVVLQEGARTVGRLGVSRSNVSMGLKELQAWNLVRLQHRPGDRRDYFSTPDDIWQIVRPLVEERKKREIDPTMTLLREVLMQEPASTEERHAQERMREMHDLFELLTGWYADVQRLDTERLVQLLTLGSKVQKIQIGRASCRERV